MKQGTLINRIVMLLLLAAVLVYLGVSAWRSFRDPYTLVLSYAYTVDDSLEATGFLVREERTVTDPETEEEKQELVTGVYVLVGQQAEFKPVTILAQLEDFALVKSADGSDGKKALRAGDEVILSSVELFDGKVITQS